jgi:phosphate starvation-inducible PhoH-like protein
VIRFKPKHAEQLQALEVLFENDIVFLCGPAGTAKTFLATYYALTRECRILLSRPNVCMGREMGFLPGEVENKLDPFLQPVFEAVEKLTGSKDRSNLEVLPIAYARGRTVEKATLIVDEAQNMEPSEFVSIMTRIGDGGKIIFCGDSMQSDIRRSPIDRVAETFDGKHRAGKSIGRFTFSRDAIVRHPLVSMILEISEGAEWNR